ncbi:hypothetical protein [Taibaiella soli]|uniref:BD-FAE-like domain-containing protein n=1 Tax=Taibaiella soli TaxID=1649169 RepID=A0A2W2ADY8_9BACT|nr:hypothetical protein [Taibaiella soli]PZF71762.1 hypothetical protein DN068_16995 [Taibaiella soli]
MTKWENSTLIYVKKYNVHRTKLFILVSGNVIEDNTEGAIEREYLQRLTKLLPSKYETAFINYSRRRTASYSSVYSKRMAVANLKNALSNLDREQDRIVLLGISVGAEIIMQFLTSKYSAKISKAICVGLFISQAKKIKVECNEVILLYGEADIIGIISHGVTTILEPKTYAPICLENICNPRGTKKFRIIKTCSHTLLTEMKMQPELLLKKIILDE